MSSDAVRAEGLGKKYRLGDRLELGRSRLLGEAVSAGARSIATRLRSGRIWPRKADIDELWAVRDVSFSVGRGEVVGIIGRNGAGKSTLLKILSRITKPTVGHANLRGRLASLLEVGTGFHPELTGRDNIYLNGAILGMRRAEIERRFDAIAAFSGVERFLDTPVKRYSSGMYVRLAFAVAAHLEPDILVVDEVLAVGDAEFQRKCIGRMQDVVGEGRTVLFVSHNMAAVKSLCGRAILLEDGRITADGPVDDVVGRYMSGDRSASQGGWIPEEAPRDGTGEARIRRVDLMDTAGHSLSQVYLGQRFQVEIDIDARGPVAGAFARVGISTLDGTPVASTESTDRDQPLWDFAAGRHRLSVSIDVTLLPRAYTLDLLLCRSDGRHVDFVQRALDFSALSVAERGRDTYRWSNVRGFVRPDARWASPEPITGAAANAASSMPGER